MSLMTVIKRPALRNDSISLWSNGGALLCTLGSYNLLLYIYIYEFCTLVSIIINENKRGLVNFTKNGSFFLSLDTVPGLAEFEQMPHFTLQKRALIRCFVSSSPSSTQLFTVTTCLLYLQVRRKRKKGVHRDWTDVFCMIDRMGKCASPWWTIVSQSMWFPFINGSN